MVMLRFVSVAAIAFFIAGCASITEDIRVASDTHPRATFGAYETFAWVASAEIVYDPQGQWELPQFDVDGEFLWLIRRELRRRGMTEVKVNPDVLVGFATGINMAALKLKRNPETRLKTLENVPKAALVVVLIDTKTGLPVWVGTATGELQEEATNDVVRKRLDFAVSEMFKQMPR